MNSNQDCILWYITDAFQKENQFLLISDPSSFDFLSQHGSGNEAAQALARQSLYVKFDPLIGGRPSIMPKNNTIQEDDQETLNNNNDLIAMNSPSPPKQAPRLSETIGKVKRSIV